VLASVTSDSFVPREFLGLARQFRAEIVVEGNQCEAQCRKLFEPLRMAWHRHPRHKVRFQMLQEAAKVWQKQPPLSRLGKPKMELRGRHQLVCAEIRLLGGTSTFSHWDNDEPEASFAAEIVTLHVSQKQCEIGFETLATFNLHCIARRFERGDRAVESVMADITALVMQHEKLIASDMSGAKIPCHHEGFWRADILPMAFKDGAPPRRVVACRTYIPQ
jgi:hypothetical protein